MNMSSKSPANANEVEVWSLFDQPSKPLEAEMKVGGDKNLHGLEKNSFKVVEMSSLCRR